MCGYQRTVTEVVITHRLIFYKLVSCLLNRNYQSKELFAIVQRYLYGFVVSDKLASARNEVHTADKTGQLSSDCVTTVGEPFGPLMPVLVLCAGMVLVFFNKAQDLADMLSA